MFLKIKSKDNDRLSGIILFVGGFLLILFHVFATLFYLYWFYWWLDVIMHLLGGFWVATLIMWILRRHSSLASYKKRFLTVFFCVMAVAVLWELFEFYIGNVDPSMGRIYWMDTFGDVTAGLLGGTLAFLSFSGSTKFLPDKEEAGGPGGIGEPFLNQTDQN